MLAAADEDVAGLGNTWVSDTGICPVLSSQHFRSWNIARSQPRDNRTLYRLGGSFFPLFRACPTGSNVSTISSVGLPIIRDDNGSTSPTASLSVDAWLEAARHLVSV